ncbi:hypothetical protein [Pedobacter nanyangensis]|uniref:hypothetical protein n=1 Tax=Pedobacter nanyangensis TaxID=1562389 RepID=UPI000DE374A8|nr:hypothetical protein [Pedobacter nanyangensis]
MKTFVIKTALKLSVIYLLFVALNSGLAYAQQNEKWLYLASDKPIKYKFVKVKEEAGRVYFQMQVKYDKTAPTYCERCLGYTIYISRSTGNPDDSYRLHYQFYQSDNTVTIPHVFSVSKSNDDGRWLSYWDDNSKMPMVKNKVGGEPEQLRFATWCVDNFKNDGVEEFNRCKRDFQGVAPVELR